MPHGSGSGDSLGLSTGSVRFAAGWVANPREPSRPPQPARAGSARPEALEPRRLLSATWFVAPGGSDTNAGTLDSPFRTIQHAADAAGPGDVVDIRGGVYRETVRPAQSGAAGAPITFQAYNGENVRIDGADPLTGWSQYQGSIYQAAAPGDLGFGNNQVFVNDQAMTEASWPATGLDLSHPKLATAQGGGYGLTDDALAGSGVDWTGGVVHIISGQGWVSQTATITGDSGNHITFNLAGTVDPHGGVHAGNRYYLTGKPDALQAPGQFFVGNGSVFLRTPDGSSPDANAVEIKHRLYGFDLSGRSNITVKGVNLFACTLVANGSDDVHVQGITAKYVSQFIRLSDGWQPPNNTGVVLNGSNNSITDSVVAYSAGDGILLLGQGNTARDNVVHDCDYTATDTAGIRTWGGGDTVDHNTIYDCGRDGIKFAMTTGTRVTGNLIHDVMLQTTDGGGVYTYGTNGAGSTIAYNRIYNIHTAGWGSAGVYLDNNSRNFSVHNNDVFDVDIGLKMNPTSFDESVVDNTLLGRLQSVASYGDRDMSGSQFIGNVFNSALMIGGSVKMQGNVASGDTSGVGSAGAGLAAGVPADPNPAPAAPVASGQGPAKDTAGTPAPIAAPAPVPAAPATPAPVVVAPVTAAPAAPPTDTEMMRADRGQIAADRRGGRAALAADAAAARATVAADRARVAADISTRKADRGDKALLSADRTQRAADRLRLGTDRAAGRAGVIQDKADLVARLKADKVRLAADRRQFRKDRKAARASRRGG